MHQKPVHLFAALLPERTFDEKLLHLKSRVEAIAGPQLYLDHPPHLTLYVASFASEDTVAAALEQSAQAINAPRLNVVGWHVFEADVLTGCHSLVCELREEDEVRLRHIQQDLVKRLAPLRDRADSSHRFEASRGRFSEDEWQNIEKRGFPYLGSIWRPHFTVASIRPQDWDRVWKELQYDAPVGDLLCPELAVYRLDGDHPVLEARFTLA